METEWIAQAERRVIAAAYDYASYDDLEPVGGCPNCDPDQPADFNAARWELRDALASLYELTSRTDRAP